MNNNPAIVYPSIIPRTHQSGESLRLFDASYNTYPTHPIAYSDYPPPPPPPPSKLEQFDYNYWPTITTHNILANPTTSSSTVLDQIQTSPSPSSQPIETLVPVPSVHLSHNNSSTTISATHHHHHIHQHLYPLSSASPSPPTYNDPSTWLGSGDYQPLHSTSNPSSYRHYSTPCSYYPPNNFYDPSPSHWTPPPTLPIKFESPYSPPPSYFESPDSLNHCHEQLSKEEPSELPPQSHWHKQQQQQQQQSSSTSFNTTPPKNPLNGKTRTRDKYRIVYTDQQRYELENEFIVSKYISIPRKSALSLTLSLSERQIKIWFQNRRAKERKLNKKRHDTSSTHQLNNSNDADSRSDGEMESPNYYPNYT